MRYRVTEVLGIPEVPMDEQDLSNARSMQEEFGLSHLSLQTINAVWRAHSDSYCAGWLIAEKEEIESVFKVRLEEDHE